MSVRLGAAPTLWNPEALAELGAPPVPWTQVLDEIAQAGYAGTEWAPTFPPDPLALKGELECRGLALAAAPWAPGLLSASEIEQAFEALDARLEALSDAGCEVLLLSEAPRPERRRVAGRVQAEGGPLLAESQWETLAGALDELARRAAGRGLSLAFRPTIGSYVETPTELKKLMNLTDPGRVGLAVDTGHLAYAGADPVETVETYWRRVRYVRLTDLDAAIRTRTLAAGRDFEHALKARVFPELGEGALDLPRLKTALTEAGWSGWLVSGQETTRLAPLAAAKANQQALKRLLPL